MTPMDCSPPLASTQPAAESPPSADRPLLSLCRPVTPQALCQRLMPVVSGDNAAAGRDRLGLSLAGQHQKQAQLDRCMLRCIYAGERVTDCELLDCMAWRNINFDSCPDLVQIRDQVLIEHLSAVEGPLARRLLHSLPNAQVRRLLPVPAIAARALRYAPWFLADIPEAMKTPESLAAMLASLPEQRRSDLLMWIERDTPQLAAQLEPMEQAIRRDAITCCRLRKEALDPGLRQLAVSQDYKALGLLGSVDAPEYSRLCDLALQRTGKALAVMKVGSRTPARVDAALSHSRGRPDMRAIPANLHSHERLKAALPQSTGSDQPAAFFSQWNLWDSLRAEPGWLRQLAYEDRTEALCRDYLDRFPGHLWLVPQALQNLHPQWRAASERSDVYLRLRDQIRVPACYGLYPDKAMPQAADAALDSQPWALALSSWHRQMEKLPSACKQQILARGGTAGLAPTFHMPSFWLEPEALLDPVQEDHCSRRAALLPDQARKALLCSQPFQLGRQKQGQALIQLMDDYTTALEDRLRNNTVPLWSPDTASRWTCRGGRTLVQTSNPGPCVHMKFQRSGESSGAFAAEAAAQAFAQAHPELGWHSEIPQPEGMYLVPLKALAPWDFPDSLQLYAWQGRQYALAFRFSTRDDSYDTLAFQADDLGSCEQARRGLLRALHDIGVWSSMGAVHTSTIRLYHQFADRDARPELLMHAFFHADAGYPGTVHLWDTEATASSDWGWSGLRDLGDLEFYPFIRTYVEAADAEWTVPDYAQRASFINAIAQNIFASLLHYMRLYRTVDPRYHYEDALSVARLERFLEAGCNSLLDGLLGDGTRLRDMFPERTRNGTDVYSTWRYKAAEEMIYWTARQSLDGHCFAAHFQKEGRPCTRLYPDHPRLDLLYGLEDDFTEPEGESLGSDHGKLPLFFLMRGLYMLAIGLADRLGAPHHSNP